MTTIDTNNPTLDKAYDVMELACQRWTGSNDGFWYAMCTAIKALDSCAEKDTLLAMCYVNQDVREFRLIARQLINRLIAESEQVESVSDSEQVITSSAVGDEWGLWLEMVVELPVGAVVLTIADSKRVIVRFCHASVKYGDNYALMHTYGKTPTDFYLLSYPHIKKLLKVGK